MVITISCTNISITLVDFETIETLKAPAKMILICLVKQLKKLA